MREGLKWSDGEPVTTEDVKICYEDIQFNEEIMPILPAWLHSGGNTEPNTNEILKIVDEFTFKLSFDEPNGGFPISLAIQKTGEDMRNLLKPVPITLNSFTKTMQNLLI